MSNPIISIESIRRLRLQNTRFLRATSISVVVSPSSAPIAGSRSGTVATIQRIVARWDRLGTHMVAPPWNRSKDPFAELISAEAIASRVRELGEKITADYRTHTETGEVVMIAVLKGSVIFLSDLMRHVALPVFVEFMGISSYG